MPKKTSKTETDRVVWDKVVPQLGVRTRGARVTWLVELKDEAGKRARRSLGLVADLDPKDAREQARALLAEGLGDARQPQTITVEEFDKRYRADRAPEWADSTCKSRACLMRRVLPPIGGKLVSELNGADVTNWLDGFGGATGSRNIALAHLSGMMRHAELLGLRPPGSNPCKGMRKRKSGFKAKYLSDAEFVRLGKALKWAETEHEMEVGFLRFLTFTGARFSEARNLHWSGVETDRVPLPDSKTGPRTIWLGKPARDVLSGLSRNGPLVFQRDGARLGELRIRDTWQVICKRARLKKFRIHDLRHNFASTGMATGESLRTVGGLLGHSGLDATQGYAHLAEGALKASAREVAKDLNRKLGVHRRRKPKAPPKAKSKSPLDAREFDLVRVFLKHTKPLSAFCAFHNLNAETFHAKVLTFRKLQKEAMA